MKIAVNLKDSTYPDLIMKIKQVFGEKTAIIDKDTVLTYQELCERSERLGKFFLINGIGHGDKVILHLGNTHIFIECMFALELIGAVPVIVFPACRENEVLSIAQTAQADAYISMRNFKGLDYNEFAGSICQKVSTIKKLFFDDEIESLNLLDYTLESSERAMPDADDIAYIVLSGGSTDIPKLIPKKHAQTLWSAEKCAEACGLDEKTRYLTAMPCAHYFHICGPGFIGTFIRGGTDIMCYSSLFSDIVDLIQKEDITETALIPSVAAECISYAEKKLGTTSVFESLRLVQLGGAMCTSDTIMQVAEKMHCIPQQIYGMGEGLVYATYPDFPLELICKYQGVNTSEYDSIRIVDESGNPVPEGEFGELTAKGPAILTGYYRNDKANREKFTADGYYKTVDRARLADGKYLQVAGRIDDMINRGGEKIFPAELEMHIRKCRNVQNAVVTGIPDSVFGSKIAAFVLCDGELTAAEIRRELVSFGLASFKIPDVIIFKKEFPLTSVKKIYKKALRQEISELSAAESDHRKNDFNEISDSVEREITVIWSDVLKTNDLIGESNFLELGGNSVSASEMLRQIAEKFNVNITMEDFYTVGNLNDFCDLVKKKISQRNTIT